MANFWKLDEENAFFTGAQCSKILYHTNLNVIIIISTSNEIVVVDVTSGAELHRTRLSESEKTCIDGVYISSCNKLILTDGVTLGMRSDYNGILIFDTILQPIAEKPYDVVEIELPHFEASLIYQALKQVELPAAESVIDLTSKLEAQIAENGINKKRGVKAEKWDTIRLKSTHNSLKWVASTMTSELRRQNRYIPALSIASAINERLNCLLPSMFSNASADRSLMFSEANRRETFTKWPHMDYKWALPDQMAQAGFYHLPNTIGDDRAMCFTCVVCLVCWESNDEPWSEHERHAPTCPFVRGEYTQNVPLSVNYATAPAITLNDRVFFGTSSLSDVFPVFSTAGVVTLYNVSRFLKIVTEFHVPTSLIDVCQSAVQSHDFSEDIWQPNDNRSKLEIPLTKSISDHILRPVYSHKITACSVLNAMLYNTFILEFENYNEKRKHIRFDSVQRSILHSKIYPCVVVAVKRTRGWSVDTHSAPSVETLNNVNNILCNNNSSGEQQKRSKHQLLLAVYDFHHKDAEDAEEHYSGGDTATNEQTLNLCKSSSAVKKSGTGTGTTISRNKDCEYYGGKIYETTTTLLDDITLMETESHSPNQNTSVNNSLQSSASFMFPPFVGSAQMTGNNTTSLSEQVESILSSTSTGTISSSEDKLRDAKADAEVGEDSNSRGNGSKSTLPKVDSMDLEKEATLIHHFCVVDNCCANLDISGLYHVPDGQHLLVVCRNNNECGDAHTDTFPASDEKDETVCGGILLLFKINFKGTVLSLEETPIERLVLAPLSATPKDLVLLPLFLKRDETHLPNGDVPMAVLLTVSGELHLINIRNLQIVSTFKNSDRKFVSVTYCDHLEKLCVGDEDGGLHFVSIIDKNYFLTEQPNLDEYDAKRCNAKKISNFISDLSMEKWSLPLKQLKLLYRLTLFENVVPCYLADVPACWNEVKQAQKQRRHPQLLQPGDSEQHTRTWKLQIGEHTWDEHIFELTLSQSMCIGHVDVKFSLHPSCQLVPNIQVTLLRLKKSDGTRSYNQESQRTENFIDQNCFSFASSSNNAASGISFSTPLNSRGYHLRHNTEVLCGPVNLIKYLDLSKRSGTITLTSSKLFRSCCRTFLLHIKAVGGFSHEAAGLETRAANEKIGNDWKKKGNLDTVLNKSSKFHNATLLEEQTSKKEQGISSGASSKKPNAGCDWIHELSITVRKPKRVDIPYEKLERCHMLDSVDFVDGLLEAFCRNDENEYRLIAMDILIWIASIRMCRFRPEDQNECSQQISFTNAIEVKFAALMQYGYIRGNRKLAHKVTKLLIACSMSCKNAQDAEMVEFDGNLLAVMVDWIPRTLQCWSAGAFRWFFQFLMYLLPHDKYSGNVPQKCFSLLVQVAKELHSRQNPYHLLLRTRYGLYGNPFESELFDIEPIIPGKSSSVPVTYANLVAGPNVTVNTASGNEAAMNGFFSLLKSVNGKEIPVKRIGQKYCNTANNNSRTDLSFLTGISASHYMKGLLEVEPLHFSCHATSDGTRVERVDTDVIDEEAIVNYYGPPTSSGGVFQPAAAFAPYTGLKKTEKVYIFQDLGDMAQTPLESLVSEEAFQHFKMSVIPKIKQSTAKNLESGGKQLIVIDSQVSGPSYLPTPIYHDKVTYSEVPSGYSDNGFPWQQLLVPPPQQTIIIDRMHSGAKRFVVLDFGFPICLTDMLVPACPELLSLSIDIWIQSEEIDGQRLVVAADIGSKMLIMSDIQPPPICRYLKITAIGRYGMNTTKCRIPIGTFYGHSYVLPCDGYAESNAYFRPNSELNIQMLCGIMEDVQCRYGLVCSRLREQLAPFLTSEISNVDHMNHYLNKGKLKNTPSELESIKISNLYKDCNTFQHQMNLIRHVMNRIGNTYVKVELTSDINTLLASASTDKLRNLVEALLDLLLYFVYELGPQVSSVPSVLYEMLNKELCQNLFTWLCVGEESRIQISMCTLLVRLYGAQAGWGKFLVNTFMELYSSNYQIVFPQDRVFVLLSYLGRKSILCGYNQNHVIEHILKALLKELLPLADTNIQGFIRGKLDLPLLSWLLMFFLQCVEVLPNPKSTSTEDGGDSVDRDNDIIRWNFIQSEVPIHRKRMMVDKKGWSRNFRRAIQKKVLQNKQQIKDLETAKKNFQLTTQALGKLSNHALKLKQELQNVLKSIPLNNVNSVQKANQKMKLMKEKVSYPGNGGGCAGANRSFYSDGVSPSILSSGKLGVDKSHCLPVIRALMAFMLHVDVTCNVDLFLISCKVMSCLLQISNSAIALNEILTEDQLLKLLQMAVWCENGKSMCGGKWTSHAITCMLQDIMDKTPKNRLVVRARRKSSSAPSEAAASSDFADLTSMESDVADSFTVYVNSNSNSAEDSSKDLLLMCSSTPKCDNTQLPSLMESDDSEVDDNLEEFLTDEKNGKELNVRNKNNLLPNISVALDSRLEYGVEESIAILLRNLVDKSSCNLLQSVNAMLPGCTNIQNNASQFKMENLTFPWVASHYVNSPSTSQMFSVAFDRLFAGFSITGPNNNLEETLSLWLLLSGKNHSEQDLFSNVVPLIPVSAGTICDIMTASWKRGTPSIRLWFLLFKTLTVASNLPFEDERMVYKTGNNISVIQNTIGTTEAIILHERFSDLISEFLSCPFVDDMAGENVVASFSNLLNRVGSRAKVVTAPEELALVLKEKLLTVLCNLLSPCGAIACRKGPLDAQIMFLSFLQECDFANVGFSRSTDIIMKTGDILSTYVQSMNFIKCCTSTEIPANPSSCFALPALKSATSAQNVDGRRVGPFSRDFLMMQVVKFGIRLLKTSSETVKTTSSTSGECKSDEHKVEEQLTILAEKGFISAKSSFVDIVLRHENKMYQFLNCLNSCYRSSLLEISDWHLPPAVRPLNNHSTVADGIYHFLNVLFSKAADCKQKMIVLCGYLSNVTSSYSLKGNASMQISDPMLWLLTKTLNSPEIIRRFNEIGGVEVVCTNLRHCFTVMLNQHSSTVSSVMQYMYGPHGFNVPTTALKSKKKHTVDRNEDGLINFAPLGTIVLDNPAAQPADVLLMSTTPHRRARSAAWSYHFYPEEKSVDLKILLPCAILLKEVHLQPHHMSLATSPKAVSLEISRGGGEYVPIQAPVQTSGLAFLHMTLYQPEIVTSVLIRCYKPKESSGIGLSQIRLLGYSAFGDRTWRNTYNDIPTDRQLMNTAIAWLRLYYHTLFVVRALPEVEEQLLNTLASSADTVNSVCGLLMLPSPLPFNFNRIIAYILLRLSLHSNELCLDIIRTVLRHGIGENWRSGKPMDPSATNSIFELLYQLCCVQDSFVTERINLVLNWLKEVAKSSVQNNNAETPIPTYVYCVSCILWASREMKLNYDLPSLLPSSLFDVLLQWSSSLPVSSALKRAVDRVLCSMYALKPQNFIALLRNLSIIFFDSDDDLTSESNNMSDDFKRKPHEFRYISLRMQPFVEFHGPVKLTNSKNLFISEKTFATLATISQSHISAQQLIDSGFLALLADVIIDFCVQAKYEDAVKESYETVGYNSKKRPLPDDALPMACTDTISSILSFLSELCWEGSVRKWLGSSEICIFWEHLLEYLCKTVPSTYTIRNNLPSESLLKLEETTIKFLSRCCWCYPKNQKTLARIVYNVIDATPRRYSKYNFGITDFTRRVLLQLVLETENIFISVEADLSEGIDCNMSVDGSVLFPPLLTFPSSRRHQLLYLNTSYTCLDIINKVIGNNEMTELATTEVKPIHMKNDVDVDDDMMDEYCDKITLAAGVTAKDKRLKDSMPGTSLYDEQWKKMKRGPEKSDSETEPNSWSYTKECMLVAPKLTLWVPTEGKYVNVCQELTLSQMLQLLVDKGDSLETPVIKFLLAKQREDEVVADDCKPKNLLEEFGYAELPSVLKEFVDTRGLEMVAHRLPMVYPTHYLRMASTIYDTPTNHNNDPSWVKLDVDIYDEIMDEKGGNAPVNIGVHPEKRVIHHNENSIFPSVIPPHSLMAFGQFLKLPNYAEWLIRDRKQAQCLLRLVLGGGDEADFNIATDPAKSLILNSLPTLPFEILRYLLKSTPITTDDGLNLRLSALNHGAIHVVLACLAIFTHQPETIRVSDSGNHHTALMMALKQCCSNVNNKKSEDKTHQYWAKGTGFGTGSTTQSWNVEQALCRQRFEEEHVTVFFQVLACYINPDFKIQDRPLNYVFEEIINMEADNSSVQQPPLPSLFVELIEHSCLLPALSSYLRNDSVLDMARHIPLYRAILLLLRVMALNSQLVKFLLPVDHSTRQSTSNDCGSNDQIISLVELLQKMKNCVDTYSSRLKKNKGNVEMNTRQSTTSLRIEEEEENGEGLATLIPDIRTTAKIVQMITEKIISKTNSYSGENIMKSAVSSTSVEEVYLQIMKKLQFDTFDMISEDTDGLGVKFNVSYHFEQNILSDGDKNHPSRMKRLAQEAVTLSTSLPLSFSSSVFVRCDTDRLDVMKVLITGPAETPYANGCFEFDVYFPPDYPNLPMLINLKTTGRHSVRFNPNLYNDGKVCLSVLNTWHGRPEEKWSAHTSSFLQVLVSIQSLILVPEPYFNEPGYERSRGTASGNQSSREYNANIMQATVRWALLDQIRNPSPCFKEIIQTHFWLKRNEITKQIANWIREIEGEGGENNKSNRSLSHGSMSLKCHFKMLCDEFAKLTPPPGLEEMSNYSQFQYKPPTSPSSPESVVDLVQTAASTSGSSSSTLHPANFIEMEKLMAELD